jgi:hypothetical protein
MGHGSKAVLGAHVVNEDEPACAVRAGLEIVKEGKAYAKKLEVRWVAPPCSALSDTLWP